MVRTGSVYGTRDPRRWTSALEDQFYHPILLARIKALRREIRNEDEAKLFLSLRNRYHTFFLTVFGAKGPLIILSIR